jgi:hypothetical protein
VPNFVPPALVGGTTWWWSTSGAPGWKRWPCEAIADGLKRRQATCCAYEPGGRRFESCRARHSDFIGVAAPLQSLAHAATRSAHRGRGRVLLGAPTACSQLHLPTIRQPTEGGQKDLLAMPTLGSLFEQFLRERTYPKNVSPKTRVWYETAWKTFPRHAGAGLRDNACRWLGFRAQPSRAL